MLGACRSAHQYTTAHNTAFTTYADGEWACALTAIDPALIRAFVLRIRSLELSGSESAYATAARELADSLGTMKAVHEFDMAQEPVLSVTGLYRPALTGLDMKLYNSPARRTQLAQALAAKKPLTGRGINHVSLPVLQTRRPFAHKQLPVGKRQTPLSPVPEY
jgi:hypothetical protein